MPDLRNLYIIYNEILIAIATLWGVAPPMGERRIADLKRQLAALNASIARLAAIGVELGENLTAAESRRIVQNAVKVRRRKLPGK